MTGRRKSANTPSLFNAPIIGLTGSEAADRPGKKQYGIYAEPVPHASMGKQMEHTGTVLLFGQRWKVRRHHFGT